MSDTKFDSILHILDHWFRESAQISLKSNDSTERMHYEGRMRALDQAKHFVEDMKRIGG